MALPLTKYIFSVIDTYCPDTTKLILNADELCSSQLKVNNDRVFYGIGKQEDDLTESVNIVSDYSFCPECGEVLEYDYLRYHHIGYAKCNKCGFHSKDADYLVKTIDKANKTLTVLVKGEEQKYPLISDITFNIYNQLTVISTLLELDYSYDDVFELVSQIKVPDSRLNHTEINGITVVQAMSKGQSCISSCRTFDFVSSENGKKAQADWVAKYNLASLGMVLKMVLCAKGVFEDPKLNVLYKLTGKTLAQAKLKNSDARWHVIDLL